MPLDVTSPNTGTSLAALAPDAVRKLWNKGVLIAEQNEDFFQQMESSSDRSIIWSKSDLAKGQGHTIEFTNMSGFYKKPKVGEALFEGPNDFEKVKIGTFKLKVDFMRNAVRTSERMEEVMGMRGEIRSKFNVELGKWLGRYKTEQMFALFQLKLNDENVLYANGKTLNTLSSADTLVWDEVVTAGQAMKPLGGLPANVAGSKAGMQIWSQSVVATEAALFSLKLDPDYKQVLREGDVRGKGNTIFRGGYPSIDGHTIVPFNPIDHDGTGPQGSFLNPKAFLGVAITAGTAAIEVQGGGTSAEADEADFFRYFPGAPYEFFDTGVLTPASETRYFLIYNLTGADAGKVGMYSYTTGNDGDSITIVNRLGSAASVARVTTLGDVTWNTGVWAGKHTDAHPEGSLIIPCNSKGVPIGDTLVLGRCAALRGYGKWRGHRSQETHNGGFITDKYITSVFGQSIREDRKGRHPAVIRLRHAVSYPGINLPTVA
jgi:hypothetical protein